MMKLTMREKDWGADGVPNDPRCHVTAASSPPSG